MYTRIFIGILFVINKRLEIAQMSITSLVNYGIPIQWNTMHLFTKQRNLSIYTDMGRPPGYIVK